MSGPLTNGLWRRMLLPAAAATPFALAVVFHLIGPRAQHVAAGEKRPALAFDHYAVDLGPIAPQRYAPAWFSFTNTCDHAVSITDIEASCGCVRPVVFPQGTLHEATLQNRSLSQSQEKRVFEPGEIGEFLIQVDTTKSEPGEREYWVKMRYDDPEPREAKVTFRVTLPGQHVVVRPPSKAYLQQSGQPTADEVYVFDSREKPLNITRIECKSPHVKAEVRETQQDRQGNWRIPIGITIAGEVPSGRERSTLKIYTDDPEYMELNLTIFIDGPLGKYRLAEHQEPSDEPKK